MVLFIERKTRRQVQRHVRSFVCALLTVFIHSRYDFAFSDEIVALKRLKMEKEKEGFPITSLREINTILKAQHPNIVTVRVQRPDNRMLSGFFYCSIVSGVFTALWHF